jgi:hypothetical protein
MSARTSPSVLTFAQQVLAIPSSTQGEFGVVCQVFFCYRLIPLEADAHRELLQDLADVDEHQRTTLVDMCRQYSDVKADVWYAERRYREIIASAESQRRDVDHLWEKFLAVKACLEELFGAALRTISQANDGDSGNIELLYETLRQSNILFSLEMCIN